MNKYEDKSLANRMKVYEAVPKIFLTLGVPKVIRLDMRAGHTFCKKFQRPFDPIFGECMIAATIALCEQIPGAMAGYTQSDEISIIMNDINKDGTFSCFFDGNVEKITSISASICSIAFNKKYFELVSKMENDKIYSKNLWSALFDSRVFCLPNVTELYNYLLWRQQDAERNSINMVGFANFSQKEMDKKNVKEVMDMLVLQKGINWNDFPTRYKRGAIVVKEKYLKDNTKYNVTVERSRWAEQEMPIVTIPYTTQLYNKEFDNKKG